MLGLTHRRTSCMLSSWCKLWGKGVELSRRGFTRQPESQTSGLQSHHQNSTKQPPREEERMKIVAGEEKKKSEILGGRVEGGPAEGGPAEEESGRAHKSWTHHENLEHTPHRHTWGVPRREVHGPKNKT